TSSWSSSSPPHEAAGFGLEPRLRDALFPFHLVLDHDLRIGAAGPALLKAMPALRVGERLAQHFTIESPAVELSFDSLASFPRTVIVLGGLTTSKLVLRGEVFVREDRRELLFVGVPRVQRIEDLPAVHISINDFPLYDSTPDLLFLLQAQRRTAAELAT